MGDERRRGEERRGGERPITIDNKVVTDQQRTIALRIGKGLERG